MDPSEPQPNRPTRDNANSVDDISTKLHEALMEISEETTAREEARQHHRAVRRLETSNFADLLRHRHHVKLTVGLTRLIGDIVGHAPDAITVAAHDGRVHLVNTTAISYMQFVAARHEPAEQLISLAVELERFAKQGTCTLTDVSGNAETLELLIAIAEDYLYYRSHGGFPTTLRLTNIALVSPGLPVS